MGEALYYWQAFHLLSRDRPFLGGMVATPRAIPLEAIRREAAERGLVGLEREIFVDVIVAVDDEWVRVEMERMAKAARDRRSSRSERVQQ